MSFTNEIKDASCPLFSMTAGVLLKFISGIDDGYPTDYFTKEIFSEIKGKTREIHLSGSISYSNSNFVTLNKPMSVIRSSGITGNAIKLNVVKGSMP